MLFCCRHCLCIDNTALSPGALDGALCTLCTTGRWHDQFPRRAYDPTHDAPLHGSGLCLGRTLRTQSEAQSRTAGTLAGRPARPATAHHP